LALCVLEELDEAELDEVELEEVDLAGVASTVETDLAGVVSGTAAVLGRITLMTVDEPESSVTLFAGTVAGSELVSVLSVTVISLLWLPAAFPEYCSG
jgi:hypothetical protein